MTSNILLRSYKMTCDTGFAPNPYFEILSLATCMPGIRKYAEIGEWIAGFTSITLCGDGKGQEKLIYLMLVSEKLCFEEYYKQYPQKRPKNCPCGDNIYKPRNGGYEQILNKYHGICEFEDDTNSPFVLLAKEFYYFGKGSVCVPKEYRPSIKHTSAPRGCITKDKQAAQDFIDWVKIEAAGRQGRIGEPHIDPKSKSCSKSCSKKKGKCR